MKRNKNKHGNKPVTIDNIWFQSGKEGRRYSELKMLERAKIISNLQLQPNFEICPAVIFDGKKCRAKFYRADFQYIENGVDIVEDVKGFRTALYLLKRNLFISLYPQYKFIET